ncbi:MAG TPA: hypothetical protein VH062_19930 [Polyangiaceae bacterium]|nr:hypothetical protein [Polyangiaceae bacterium]
MSPFVRALLWIVMVVAPGGVFLLPLLVGDAVARRRKQENGVTSRVAVPPQAESTVAPAVASTPPCV